MCSTPAFRMIVLSVAAGILSMGGCPSQQAEPLSIRVQDSLPVLSAVQRDACDALPEPQRSECIRKRNEQYWKSVWEAYQLQQAAIQQSEQLWKDMMRSLQDAQRDAIRNLRASVTPWAAPGDTVQVSAVASSSDGSTFTFDPGSTVTVNLGGELHTASMQGSFTVALEQIDDHWTGPVTGFSLLVEEPGNPHSVTVMARDCCGNTASSYLTFRLDIDDPTQYSGELRVLAQLSQPYLGDATVAIVLPVTSDSVTNVTRIECLVELDDILRVLDAYATPSPDDCNGNGVPDALDIAGDATQDCNGNGALDVCELANLTQFDTNGNGILEPGCESLDCNGDSIPDHQQLAQVDLNKNGYVDSCETDCDGNGVFDLDEITSGSAADCNHNGVPDECDTAGGIAFAPPATYLTPYSDTAVVAGDWDNDQDLDLATCSDATGFLTTLRNLGGGVYGPAQTFNANQPRTALATADFDRDGKLDIVVVGGTAGGVATIMRNTGNGIFSATLSYPVASYPFSVAAADIDNDNDADLIVPGLASNTVHVLKNNGFGQFGAPQIYATDPGPVSVAVADMTGDGLRDVAIVNRVARTLQIRRNIGGGNLAAPITVALAVDPISVTAANVTGDARAEVLVVSDTGNAVIAYTVSGAAAVPSFSIQLGLDSPTSLSVGDFDGDGRVDLALACHASDRAAVVRQDDGLQFEPPLYFPTGPTPLSLYVDDVNADGRPDYAIAGQTGVSVHVNQPSVGTSADTNANGVPDECETDSDGDNLTDADERGKYGTDPYDADSDDDGLTDNQEVGWGTNPVNADSDGDGLSDSAEIAHRSDPLDPDTDDDGVSDSVEQARGSSSRRHDTDGDGLTDAEEINIYNTDPTRADTDGDGLTDFQETWYYGTNPLDPDSDDDGLTDGQEVGWGTNPLDADSDDDGLNDGGEIANDSDPLDPDTDDDGLNDERELYYGTDPQNPDSDGDTLTDGAEVNTHNTNPTDADSDDDGVDDGFEVFRGSNPNRRDSDDDGLLDPEEFGTFTIIRYSGSSAAYAEGLLSGAVTLVQVASSPINPDTDGDGISDWDELNTYALAALPDGSVPSIGLGPAAERAGRLVLRVGMTAADLPFLDVRRNPARFPVLWSKPLNGVRIDPTLPDSDGDGFPDPQDPAPQANPIHWGYAAATPQDEIVDVDDDDDGFLEAPDANGDGLPDFTSYSEATLEQAFGIDFSNDGTLGDGFDVGGVNRGPADPSGEFGTYRVGSHPADADFGDGELDALDSQGQLMPDDNCDEAANPDQADADGDGRGDACEARRGDTNCDGVIDFFDIDPLLLALFDPAGYAQQYPGCDRMTADLNGDLNVDFFDIDPFLDCLFTGNCQ